VVLFLLTKGSEMNLSVKDETPIDIAGLCGNFNVRIAILINGRVFK
jgi:hypothetical protein